MRKYFTGECVPVTQVHIQHSFHLYTAHCFLDLVSFITYDITCPGRIYDKTVPLCSPKSFHRAVSPYCPLPVLLFYTETADSL